MRIMEFQAGVMAEEVSEALARNDDCLDDHVGDQYSKNIDKQEVVASLMKPRENFSSRSCGGLAR